MSGSTGRRRGARSRGAPVARKRGLRADPTRREHAPRLAAGLAGFRGELAAAGCAPLGGAAEAAAYLAYCSLAEYGCVVAVGAAGGGRCVLRAAREGEGDRLVVPLAAAEPLTPAGLGAALAGAAALDRAAAPEGAAAPHGPGEGPAPPAPPAQVTLAFSDGHMVSFLPVHAGLHAPEGQPPPVPRRCAGRGGGQGGGAGAGDRGAGAAPA